MLNDKIAWVTGASRGIGAGIAFMLAAEGAEVIGTATTADGAEQITRILSTAHHPGQGRVLDISNPATVEQFVKSLAEKMPDILVNNAGITRDNLTMRMKDSDWQIVLDTNLGGIFHLTRLCLRHMLKARWGRIVNIGSVVAAMGNPGQVNYCAAKAGLEGFSRALAREVAARGITVNTVAPGFIETDMTRDLPAAQREALASRIPAARLGKPEDVAAAVAYLASDAAAYVTGQTLHVNGGLYSAS